MKVRPITYICATVMCLCTITVRSQTEFQKEKLLTCFFENGRPIGQPFTSKQPCIRMVRVNSYKDAYEFFNQLCLPPGILDIYRDKEYIFYRYSFQGDGGSLLFTNKVVPKRNEVAVLWINMPFLVSQKVKRLHFVKTIKIKQKN